MDFIRCTCSVLNWIFYHFCLYSTRMRHPFFIHSWQNRQFPPLRWCVVSPTITGTWYRVKTRSTINDRASFSRHQLNWLFRPWDLCPDLRLKDRLTFIYNRRCVREVNIPDPHREGNWQCVMTYVHHLNSFVARIDIWRQYLMSIRQILTYSRSPHKK